MKPKKQPKYKKANSVLRNTIFDKYSKTFYKQEDLKTTVLNNKYKKGTLGQELKNFWENNTDDLFQKNFNLAQTKGKKIESVVLLIEGNLEIDKIAKLISKMDLPGGKQLKMSGI